MSEISEHPSPSPESGIPALALSLNQDSGPRVACGNAGACLAARRPAGVHTGPRPSRAVLSVATDLSVAPGAAADPARRRWHWQPAACR
jgi:hypothetical protein